MSAMSVRRRSALARSAIVRLGGVLSAMALLLLVPAGTIRYWPGWAYCGVLAIPLMFVLAYFLRKDPAFLERRMRHRERETTQKAVVAASMLLFLAAFIVSPLDWRFGWSRVPVWAMVLADALVFGGYLFVFAVFRENSYASRVVEVQKSQRVISTGPYAVVRHPMYAGVLVMYLATPVALGSLWGLLPMIPVVAALGIRAVNEEAVLARGLPGYRSYMRRVRWRIVPGIW